MLGPLDFPLLLQKEISESFSMTKSGIFGFWKSVRLLISCLAEDIVLEKDLTCMDVKHDKTSDRTRKEGNCNEFTGEERLCYNFKLDSTPPKLTLSVNFELKDKNELAPIPTLGCLSDTNGKEIETRIKTMKTGTDARFSLENPVNSDQHLPISPLKRFLALEHESSCLVNSDSFHERNMPNRKQSLSCLNEPQLSKVMTPFVSEPSPKPESYEMQLATNEEIKIATQNSESIPVVILFSRMATGFAEHTTSSVGKDNVCATENFKSSNLRVFGKRSNNLYHALKLNKVIKNPSLVVLGAGRSRRTSQRIINHLTKLTACSSNIKRIRKLKFFKKGEMKKDLVENTVLARAIARNCIDNLTSQIKDEPTDSELCSIKTSFVPSSNNFGGQENDQITWKRISKVPVADSLPLPLNLNTSKVNASEISCQFSKSPSGVTIFSNIEPKEKTFSRMLSMLKRNNSKPRVKEKLTKRQLKDLIDAIGRTFYLENRDEAKDYVTKEVSTNKDSAANLFSVNRTRKEILLASLSGNMEKQNTSPLVLKSDEKIKTDATRVQLPLMPNTEGNAIDPTKSSVSDEVLVIEKDNWSYQTYEVLASKADVFCLEESSIAALLCVMSEEAQLNMSN